MNIKKPITRLLILCCAVFLSITAIAQNKNNTTAVKQLSNVSPVISNPIYKGKYAKSYQKVIEATNTQGLLELQRQFKAADLLSKSETRSYALLRNIPVRFEKEDGTLVELQHITADGTPIYFTTFNDDAAISTRTNYLNTGGGLGLDLNGDDLVAHVWDGGLARSTHQEYDGTGGVNRFSIGDGTSALHYHSAHVTGTIMASGVQAAAKGMAWQADAVGYDWNNDESEATTAAAGGMLISNHSYGYAMRDINGNPQLPTLWLGGYISDSRNWDNIMYNAPYFLMVVAAGNDGNDNGGNTDPLDGQTAYDKLSGHATAKNNLVIANGQDASINGDGSLNSVTRNSSSSEGPTDDYRIKPDLMGNGTSLYSTYETSDTAYNSISGTSMASPNVAGTLLILQEHYNNLNGSFMRAATLKGLALHTADDAGASGPDAQYGWGLLNAKKAAETLTTAAAASGSAIVDELTLTNGQTYQITVQSNSVDPLMASISWTDQGGTIQTVTNDNSSRLVNDLDVRVTQAATTYTPWRLTGVTTNGTGDNDVDPFERIDVSGASGMYTITVTHKGTLSSPQNFTLITTGIVTALTPEISFAQTTMTQLENSDCSFTDISVPVNIAQIPSQDAEVTFSVAGGTATDGIDFSILTPTVTFPTTGTDSQNLIIRMYHDDFVEGDETLIVDFTVNNNGGDATANTNADSLTLTINDDDFGPTALTTYTLFSEDFEDITGWINTESTVDNELWLYITGLDGVGDFVGRGIGSVTNDAAIGGLGTLYDPENYLISEAITIPDNATNTAFTYSVYGASSSLEYYTIRWTEDISSFAAIDAGQLIEERFATASTADTRTVNLTDIEGQTGYFVMIHDNPVAPSSSHGLLVIDTVNIDVTIETAVQTAVNSGTTNDSVNINGTGSAYGYDSGGDIMSLIVNNDSFDYGCTDVSVSRAGITAQSYNGSSLPDLVMDKTFTLAPANTNGAGDVTLTFYFSEDEIDGWETTTGLLRGDLVAGRGNASSVSEVANLTIGAFGDNITLTGNFTGLDGTFYFGNADTFILPCSGPLKTWVAGAWSPLGSPTAANNVVISDTYSTISNGNIDACALTVSDGVTLTIDANTYAKLDGNISVNGTGSLIVKHTGSIVQVDPIASVTKDPTATINVEITTPVLSNRDFMVMGSPMDAETRNGVFTDAFLVLNNTPANFYPLAGVPSGGTNFVDDKNTNGKWLAVYNSTINVGEGYIVRPQTAYNDPAVTSYDMTYALGTLNNGDITMPLGYNGPVNNPTGTPHLMANPYASPISAQSLINNNALINEVYFWEHLTPPSPSLPGSNAMNFDMDDLSIYNGSMGIPAPNDPGISTTPNGVISTGQGFAIKSQGIGTLTFENNMRLTSGNTTLRNVNEETQIDKLTLEVRNTEYGVGSYTGIAFNAQATEGFDDRLDTQRLASIISIFSHLQDGSQQLGIQTMPAFENNVKIPLGFTTQVPAELEYVISIAKREGTELETTNIYLIDNLLGMITNLTETDYSFKSNKQTYEGRFTLQFEAEVLGVQDVFASSVSFYPNPTESILNITSLTAGIDKVIIHDIAGRKISELAYSAKKNISMDLSQLDAAVYFVTVNTEGGAVTKRIVRK